MTTNTAPNAPQARPPALQVGPIAWLRTNLFSSWLNSILTLIGLYIAGYLLWKLVPWAIIHAVWSGTPADCAAVQGEGACWAIVKEKHRFTLFGRYTYEEQWRPLVAVLLFIAMMAISFVRRFWTRWLAYAWIATLVIFGILMWGGIFGLPFVSQELWGGLPLTLVLAVVGIVCAFPLGVVLALGRRSRLPAIRAVCVAYIELIRGVPLITVLFMASVMIPLFLPGGVSVDKLLRAQIGIVLFTAAYLAEAIRGGLQAIPKGQFEAADALGMGYWLQTRKIILPQALRLVIPPLVNSSISTFKDTSLVIVIGLFDLLTAGKLAFNDPPWRSFYVELYLFMALIYFAFCFSMSKFSRAVEADLKKGHNR